MLLKKESGIDGIVAMIKNINLYIGGFSHLAFVVMNIWGYITWIFNRIAACIITLYLVDDVYPI